MKSDLEIHEECARIQEQLENQRDEAIARADRLERERADERDHPWADFLAARVRAIRWLRSQRKTSGEIAQAVSLDASQVFSILLKSDILPEETHMEEKS